LAATPLPTGALPPPSPPEAVLTEGAHLIVAGPEGGTLVHWAAALVPAMQGALPPGTRLTIETLGAADGVTGANRFGARAAPDGLSLLLAPGEAVIDWLVGESRIQFDAGHWVGVLAGMTPAVVMGRAGTDGLALPAMPPGHPAKPGPRALRVAAGAPNSPDLALEIALSLLGIAMVPVFGIQGPEAQRAAFAAGQVDVVLLRGHQVPAQVTALRAAGAVPSFSLGAIDAQGRAVPDPDFPSLADFPALYTQRMGHAPVGPLFDAWIAMALAARLEFAMVLPQLTPAALVALWRRAGAQAAGALPVQARAEPLGVRILGEVAGTTAIARLSPDATALLALRGWLARQEARAPRR
ncbi:MAG: hypothetical protein KGL12_12455, partial [Rhodospirillales bacterium]|nr:hypothetical protein [Rhodospirillales bacterium]